MAGFPFSFRFFAKAMSFSTSPVGALPPPMLMRSFMRVVSATRQPLPTSSTRFASGMRTSVKNTSLKFAPPVICFSGLTSTPGVSMSSMK